MKLIITGPLQQKIDYLLNRFDIEWSGPAWFTYVATAKGFPNKWKLEYFLPLDLGSHSETEWTGKHFLQRSKKLYKEHPELLKMYQGNIHSHHTMGAFFSSTDQKALIDNANEVGYPSLVVANGGKADHAFAMSYLDQWRHPHMFEASDIEVEIDIEENDEWVKEANTIQKRYDKHKKKSKSLISNTQVTLWSPKDYHNRTSVREAMYGSSDIGVTDDKVKQELDKAKDPKERYQIAIDALEMGFMDQSDFQKEVDRLGTHFEPREVDSIHAKYMEERDDTDEITDYNAGFGCG